MVLGIRAMTPHTHYSSFFFFFNRPATTEIYTLSLHDALPICVIPRPAQSLPRAPVPAVPLPWTPGRLCPRINAYVTADRDRKSTRLNSSHANISYAVFCLKKKTPTCSHQNRND